MRKPIQPIPGQKPQRSSSHGWRYWLTRAFLSLLLVLAAWAGRWLWLRGTTPEPPSISTSGLDRAIAALVTQTENEIRSAPGSGAAWGKLGMILQGADFKVEARTCFSQAERLEPKEPRWPYFHGLLLQDESEAAIARLERAAQLCGDEPDTPRLRLAQLLAENGRFDQAERHFKELLRKRSDHAPALLGLARLSNARGRFAETANFLRPALEDVHTARSAYLLLANVQRRSGNETAAETTARVAATLPADDQWPDPYLLQTSRYQIGQQALVDRGVQLLKQGRIAEAVPTIDRVINEYPDSAEGWLLLGRLRLKQKDCASAEQAVRHHLRLDPRSANGYVQLGMAHLCQEQYSAAAASFQEALQLKPDLGPAHFNLGFAQAREGKLTEAIESFRQAIRYSPDFVDSYISLADLLRQAGHKEEAVAQLRRALELNPSERRAKLLLERIQSR